MVPCGLVLEGGGMRGIFTAGVLDFFLDKELIFPQIIGVSAGACHGVSFVAGQRERAKNVVVDYINDRRYCSIYSLLTTGDMFGVKFAYYDIPDRLNLFDRAAYAKRQTKLFAAVTNVETGGAEYIELKDFSTDIEALRASASLPLISRTVSFNGKKYLDGGISDSIPIRRIQADGFEKNVVVLTQPEGYVKKSAGSMRLMKLRYGKYPEFLKSMANRHEMYNDTLAYIKKCEAAGMVFVIRPEADLKLGRLEKDRDKLEDAYYKGYHTAEKNYETLLKFIKP